MTNLAYNQSLSMLTSGSHTSSAGLKTSYSYPLNLYSFYIIASTSSTLSSVLALIDRSYLLHGVRTLSSYLSGLVVGMEALSTRQDGSNFYAWNATIVEPVSGAAADTGALSQWLSYSGQSGLKEGGVREYGRYLKEVDDEIVSDVQGWKTIEVSETRALPYVEGEPLV
jgi:hypothetical protein